MGGEVSTKHVPRTSHTTHAFHHCTLHTSAGSPTRVQRGARLTTLDFASTRESWKRIDGPQGTRVKLRFPAVGQLSSCMCVSSVPPLVCTTVSREPPAVQDINPKKEALVSFDGLMLGQYVREGRQCRHLVGNRREGTTDEAHGSGQTKGTTKGSQT